MIKKILLPAFITFALFLVLFFIDLLMYASFYNELIIIPSKIIIYISFALSPFIVGTGYKIIKNEKLFNTQIIFIISLYSLLFFSFICFTPTSFDIMLRSWHISNAIKEIPLILISSLIGYLGFYFGNRIRLIKAFNKLKINNFIIIIPVLMFLLHAIFFILNFCIITTLFYRFGYLNSFVEDTLFTGIILLPAIIVSLFSEKLYKNNFKNKLFISIFYIMICNFSYLLSIKFKFANINVIQIFLILLILRMIFVYYSIDQTCKIRNVSLTSINPKSKFLNYSLIFIAYSLALIPIYLINKEIINILPVNILLSLLPLLVVWGLLKLLYREIKEAGTLELTGDENQPSTT